MNRHLSAIKNLSDEELVRLIRLTDNDAFIKLYERYLPKIRAMAFSFQGLGYDIDDLVQEATLGFYSAIQAYDFKSASFSTFCYTCTRRMLIALVRKGFKKSSVPESFVVHFEDETLNICSGSNPEQELIAKEEYYRLREKITNILSENERVVLFEYLKGMNYSQIALKLNVSRKTVDNALQRVRKKLR